MPIPGQHTASPAAETVRPDGPGRQDGRAAEKCWHLITIGKTNRWRAVTEALQRAIAAMGAEEGAPELFAPRVCRLHGAESGRPHRVETPLLLNYAFLRASAAELRTLRAACPEVNPVIDRASEASAEGRRRYVTLSDAAVEAFRRIAAAEADNLPVYVPGEIDLTTADTVRVVDGPFRGIGLPHRPGDRQRLLRLDHPHRAPLHSPGGFRPASARHLRHPRRLHRAPPPPPPPRPGRRRRLPHLRPESP